MRAAALFIASNFMIAPTLVIWVTTKQFNLTDVSPPDAEFWFSLPGLISLTFVLILAVPGELTFDATKGADGIVQLVATPLLVMTADKVASTVLPNVAEHAFPAILAVVAFQLVMKVTRTTVSMTYM